jgi:enamine deaminase RidA (YjgF/YER057c/UK114 family)
LTKSNRRKFIAKSAGAAAITGAAATPGSAQSKATEKRVIYPNGKKPENPLFSSIVLYGNLVFLAGVGAHFEGDIKAHTNHVLDEVQKNLEAAGSSMEKVLKCQVYLADLKDYDGMNEVFRGRFGPEPPVRTTIAAAGVPGKSLVEIDVIAYT